MLTLHFASLIPYELENGDVFLITDDKMCTLNVEQAVESKGKQYSHKLKIFDYATFNTYIR